MENIQFIQVDDDHLRGIVSSCIKSEFDKIRTDFQPKQPTEYMTRQQVKEYFDVDLSTIHNWTKRGKLKAYGIAGRVYYKRAEVEESIKPMRP